MSTSRDKRLVNKDFFARIEDRRKVILSRFEPGSFSGFGRTGIGAFWSLARRKNGANGTAGVSPQIAEIRDECKLSP
jgi:hypothetical protein